MTTIDSSTLSELISARRQLIEDNAPCESCGSTLAYCKSHRGEDPDAPKWFGCCARGIDLMMPCHHIPSAQAYRELLREIETNSVRTIEEIQAAEVPKKKPGMGWDQYMDQTKVWRPNNKPFINISDMDPEWRYNASRWLENHAASIANRYTMASSLNILGSLIYGSGGLSEASFDSIQDAEEQAEEARDADPVAWIKTTPLYQALIADLPTSEQDLTELQLRASHMSTCPMRMGTGPCNCRRTYDSATSS